MIALRKISTKCGKMEYEMFQGIKSEENGVSNPAKELNYEQFKSWVKDMVSHSKGENLPNGWVKCTTYILYVDNVPVGFGRVRHESVPYLEQVIGVGNFGYAISSDFRGMGYGGILFKKLLKKCKLLGYKKIKLYPYKNNLPTLKIMYKNGGKKVGEFKNVKYILEFNL